MAIPHLLYLAFTDLRVHSLSDLDLTRLGMLLPPLTLISHLHLLSLRRAHNSGLNHLFVLRWKLHKLLLREPHILQ